MNMRKYLHALTPSLSSPPSWHESVLIDADLEDTI